MKLLRAKQFVMLETWNRLVKPEVQRRIIKLAYVKHWNGAVILTSEGLSVLAYRESTG